MDRIKNKEFLEELMAYFTLIRHVLHRERSFELLNSDAFNIQLQIIRQWMKDKL